MNALKTKENRFGILHLNITSLYKHVDGLSNLSFKLCEIKFSNYGLSEHEIGLNTLTLIFF